MKLLKVLAIALLAVTIIAVNQSCKQLMKVSQSLLDLQKLQFKLENVNNFRLAGVGLSSKKSISDFSLTDGLNLTKAYTTKKFPAEFILNVAAINPNDGSRGTQKTTSTLTSFSWRLIIDDVETVSGIVNKAIEIPGTGQATTIPLTIQLDLYQFFAGKGKDGILNLALALGGMNSSPARLQLKATPSVSTPIGPIRMGEMTIVSHEYR